MNMDRKTIFYSFILAFLLLSTACSGSKIPLYKQNDIFNLRMYEFYSNSDLIDMGYEYNSKIKLGNGDVWTTYAHPDYPIKAVCVKDMVKRVEYLPSEGNNTLLKTGKMCEQFGFLNVKNFSRAIADAEDEMSTILTSKTTDNMMIFGIEGINEEKKIYQSVYVVIS